MSNNQRKVSDIDSIIIHCSDSEWGDREEIRKWHIAKGFDDIGYHFVITNGKIKNKDKYNIANDGIVQIGRSINMIGAHCQGNNKNSIGICLIGKEYFTGRQLYFSLPLLFSELKKINIKTENVFCHYQLDKSKTCPNIYIDFIRNIYHIVMFNPFPFL